MSVNTNNTGNSRPPTATKSKPRDKALKEWTKQDVQKWLDKNELGHIGPKMQRFDGKLLVQLRNMYRASPGVGFYQSARDFLKIDDLPDLLHLANLLEELE